MRSMIWSIRSRSCWFCERSEFSFSLSIKFWRNQVAFLERAQDRLPELLHELLLRALHIHLVNSIGGFEAALQEKVGEAVHQFLEVDVVGGIRCVSGILDVFHNAFPVPAKLRD